MYNKKYMNQTKNKGFTLIELLVVVAIISLLTSVVLASLTSAKKKATDTKIISEYQQLKIALEMYYNDNGKYPTAAAGTYCIGATTCKLAGSSSFLQLNTTPPFTYKPSMTVADPNNQGFLYQIPVSGSPKIILTTPTFGAQNATVGIWTLSQGSN